MPNIRDCRLLIEVDAGFKKVCRLVFSKSDASLYLIPYGNEGTYLWGQGTFSKGSTKATFSHSDARGTQERLKLSIHGTGQVHVKSLKDQDYKAGPLRTRPLWDYRGQHLASISIDSLESLPDAGKIKGKPRSPELLLKASDIDYSRRFVLYANGEEPVFTVPVKSTVSMYRAGLPSPLHIGITTYKQDPLASDEKGGVIIICGWDPHEEDLMSEEEILWVRAI